MGYFLFAGGFVVVLGVLVLEFLFICFYFFVFCVLVFVDIEFIIVFLVSLDCLMMVVDGNGGCYVL